MKKLQLILFLVTFCMISSPVFAQTDEDKAKNEKEVPGGGGPDEQEKLGRPPDDWRDIKKSTHPPKDKMDKQNKPKTEPADPATHDEDWVKAQNEDKPCQPRKPDHPHEQHQTDDRGEVKPGNSNDQPPKGVRSDEMGEVEEGQGGNALGKDKSKDKGHAYGKDKGELSGKEFGQTRAEQAKLNKEKLQKAGKAHQNASEKIQASRLKIEQARAKLDEKLGNQEISEADYERVISELDKSEQALQKLEADLVHQKEVSEKAKSEIKPAGER